MNQDFEDQPEDAENDRPPICPFCGSRDTEPYALFGSMQLLTQHYCRACRSVFERIRDDDAPDDLPPAPRTLNS